MSDHLPPTNRKEGPPRWVIGCLAILAVGVVLTAVGIYIFVTKAKEFVTERTRTELAAQIERSDLPEDQKRRIVEQVDRIATEFKEGDISLEEMARIAERLVESPLLPVILVHGAREAWIEPSSLTEEEKTGSKVTLDRFARGVFEKKISERDAEHVMDPLMVQNSDGQRTFKENHTTEDLRSFLQRAEEAADEAEIPSEPYQVDFAEEIRKAVDDARRGPDAPEPR